MANQRRVAFSLSDKWTNPNVALFLNEHYARFGLWVSMAISKTTVCFLLILSQSVSKYYPCLQINNEEVNYFILARGQCVLRNQKDRYRHLVPGFGNYTENKYN